MASGRPNSEPGVVGAESIIKCDGGVKGKKEEVLRRRRGTSCIGS